MGQNPFGPATDPAWTTGEDDNGFFSGVGEGLSAAVDAVWSVAGDAVGTLFGGVARGLKQATEDIAEAGAKTVEEAFPIWVANAFGQQQEDQLDDPTLGDLADTLAKRINDGLRTSLGFEERGRTGAPGSGTFGGLEPLELALLAGAGIVLLVVLSR